VGITSVHHADASAKPDPAGWAAAEPGRIDGPKVGYRWAPLSRLGGKARRLNELPLANSFW
jgi:hypothetical protein